jgi:hypothetical protein
MHRKPHKTPNCQTNERKKNTQLKQKQRDKQGGGNRKNLLVKN